MRQLTGIVLAEDEITAILTRLGFVCEAAGDVMRVTTPSWRPDIDGQADLVEEVTRIYGMDNVPSVPLPRPHAVARPILTPLQKRVALSRRVLAARGMVEVVTWSFIPQQHAERFGGSPGQKLANPISSELSHMRPSLMPGLLMAVGRNQDRGFGDMAVLRSAKNLPVPRQQSNDLPRQACGRGILRRATGLASKRRLMCLMPKLMQKPCWQPMALRLIVCGLRRARQIGSTLGGQVFCSETRARLWLILGKSTQPFLKSFDVKGPLVGFEVFPENIPLPKAKPTKAKPALNLSNLQAVRRFCL